MTTRPRFWMIARKPTGPGSKTEPRQRYGTYQDARRAAQRLATQTGHQYVILEAIEAVHPTDQDIGELPL